MNRGGKRNGAGRPEGSKISKKTEIFYKRCTPEKKKWLQQKSEEYKEPDK